MDAIAERIAAAELLERKGDFPAALALLSALLQASPGHPAILLALAHLSEAMGAADGALELIELVRQLAPDDPAPMLRLGYALRRGMAYRRAASVAAATILRHPDLAAAWTSHGISLYTDGDLGLAERCFDRAVMLDPSDAIAQFSRATCLLAAGRWAEGLSGFAWRRRLPDAVAAPAGLPAPRGGERRLLIWNDQGLGDAIQFLRYVPLLRRRGVEPVLLLPPSLVRLARTMKGVGEVVSLGQPLPPVDAHMPLMDVPAFLGAGAIPADGPYLTADPHEKLAALDGFKVGLVWAGAARTGNFQAHALDRRRSLDPAQLAPLLAVPGVSFVSLQLGASLPGTFDAMTEIADFADTAALVAALDLVISVDTSVAHLAGALGKPVWILSRYDGCWRWLREREDSPWYPTARLFRQAIPGDWAPVVAELAAALGAEVAARL